MVEVEFGSAFIKKLQKIGDRLLKTKISKQVIKVVRNPFIGKPMRNSRKGTREVYVRPFRLSYVYHPKLDRVEFLDFYHKDEQ